MYLVTFHHWLILILSLMLQEVEHILNTSYTVGLIYAGIMFNNTFKFFKRCADNS